MFHNNKISISVLKLMTFISIFSTAFSVFLNKKIYFLNLYDFVIILSAISVFFYSKKIHLTKYFLGFVIFIIYVAITLFWSISIGIYLMRIKDLMVNLCLMYTIMQFCLQSKKGEDILKNTLYCMTIFVCCTFALTVICYLYEGSNILTWPRLGRVLFGKYGLTIISYSVILLISLYLCVFLYVEKKENKYIYIFIFLYISTILTGVRKTLVLPLLCLFMFVLLRNKRKPIKMLLYSIAFIIFGIIVFNFVMKYSITMSRRITALINQLNGFGVEDSYTGRVLLQQLAIKCFYQHPLFGVGLGQFRLYSLYHGGPDLYAHNNYLELLTGVGIIGTLIYYLNIIRLLVFSKNKNVNIKSFLLSIFIVMTISDFVQVSYYFSCFTFLFALLSCLNKCTKIN